MATITLPSGDVLTYTLSYPTESDGDKTNASFTPTSVKIKKSSHATTWIVYFGSSSAGANQSVGGEYWYRTNQTYSSDTTVSFTKTLNVSLANYGGQTYYVVFKVTRSGGTDETKNVAVTLPQATYAIKYDGNGNTSGSTSAQTKTHGTNITLQQNGFVRTNYVFAHWNTSSTDSGTTYNAGASYSTNNGVTLYAIWNPRIYYNANGGSGTPAAAVKTYGSTYTVSSTVPTRSGYTFDGWNTASDGTGTAYASGATMAASQNTSVTLYAQWVKNGVAPTISSLTVVRSNSSGTQDDSGTYCKVRATWSIDTTNVTGNTATVTGTIKPDGGSTRTITFTSGASGTSGTAVALVDNCDTDKQYTITITVTDAQPKATSRSNIMTRAFFILDLKAGGNAMGIGTAAPSAGLEVGWAAQFDEAVTLLKTLAVTGNLTVGGTITASQFDPVDADSDIATAGSGWAIQSQSARTIGKVCMVRVTLRPNEAKAADTAISSLCTLKSGYRPKDTQGFANYYGSGQVTSGGAVSFRTSASVSTTTNVVVGLCFMKS